jgi:hypothetical protein
MMEEVYVFIDHGEAGVSKLVNEKLAGRKVKKLNWVVGPGRKRFGKPSNKVFVAFAGEMTDLVLHNAPSTLLYFGPREVYACVINKARQRGWNVEEYPVEFVTTGF